MEKRIIPCGAKYESKIYVIDKLKLIYKLDCLCGDFNGVYREKTCSKKTLCPLCLVEKNNNGCGVIFDKKFYPGKRKKSVGNYSDKKIFYSACKHLRLLVETLINKGYTLKSPKEEGTIVCTQKLRNFLIERSKGLCECSTSCQDTGEDCHRLIRGNNGGLYSESNCKLLSKEHHKLFHSNENQAVQGK